MKLHPTGSRTKQGVLPGGLKFLLTPVAGVGEQLPCLLPHPGLMDTAALVRAEKPGPPAAIHAELKRLPTHLTRYIDNITLWDTDRTVDCHTPPSVPFIRPKRRVHSGPI
ncbi:MAG: hypothetical protein H7839_22180 [Magnetococcus sp. YQC-5]